MIVFVLCLILSFASFASNCFDEAKSLLQNPSEIYVFERHPYMHQFIDCESPTKGMEVVIHETVHFEDLGIPTKITAIELEEWFRNNPIMKADIYSLDGIHNGAIILDNAPTPKTLVLKFLNENYAEVMKNEDHPIHGWLEGYILDDSTLASYSFPSGLTELNAYIHGLIIEYRIKKDLPPENPYQNLIVQRWGLWHFLFLLKAYTYELKNNSSNEWLLLNNDHNSKIIRSLIHDARKALTESSHCELVNEGEISLFKLFSDPRYFSGLKEILGSEDNLNQILCQE